MKKVFQFVSTNVLSGLENVVINICTLVKGYKFVYVSPSGSIDNWLNKYHIKHISVNKITPLSVNRVIRKYNPDIVQGHDVKASLSLACNYPLCHRRHIKMLSELHNDDPRMWHYTLRSILYALSSPFYDNIIVISSAVIKHYIFKNLIKHKTVVINNIVNTNRIDIKDHYSKKWDCIFLGRLVNQKDPFKFVKIIESLKENNRNIHAIIVGRGPLLNKLRCYINSHNLRNNIKMLGFKNNPFKYLAESKLLIMPSKYEGFGLVALESLLVGTPVICSHTGGLMAIINTNCGYFANTIVDYVNKIQRLLNNKRIYNIKVLLSYKRFKELNRLKIFVLGYKRVYSK